MAAAESGLGNATDEVHSRGRRNVEEMDVMRWRQNLDSL